jgi:putative GTP pyrophosphokinase
VDVVPLTRAESATLESLVAVYEQHTAQIGLFRDQLLLALSSSARLNAVVHSFRSRLKDQSHLLDKLTRKYLKCKSDGQPFDIDKDNLLLKINDLVGVRILHLYTRQIREIDGALREVFQEGKYDLLEGPFARSWDDESRQFFRDCQIETQDSPSMYTSVHYVIGSASRTKVTAEIQVRTLAEEVWGEVDHSINYPHKTDSVACAEQLKVLARVTSSASRLVDSIFLTLEDDRNRRGSSETTTVRRVAAKRPRSVGAARSRAERRPARPAKRRR